MKLSFSVYSILIKLFIRFFGLENHNTLSRPELVRSVFKTTQSIIKATSVDILHPKFCPTHCPDILSGLDMKLKIHIKSTYDGTEVSKKEILEQWLRNGLQIKIIYPFCVKPWRDSRFQTSRGIKKYLLINKKKSHLKIHHGEYTPILF